ncbi:unnamed protein product [Euphydryas editha]|uniref:RRM domain-containing protein n=1 Tax=Euphydryas editha TaxID=104508 RepID=A0AAU9UD72_EUPED|nr:unnamed protein product [Euphydryas editha]
MDYVVGSVAALISGNVTPNRPKRLKKADTPMKHQPSPNVTPKSEFVDDRSIFLSPSMQKKKAIIKKSPKRIFQNPDLDVTKDEEESTLTSPKANKVKKHLKEELDANSAAAPIMLSPKSSNDDQEKVPQSPSKKKKLKISKDNIVNVNESPSKKKKRRKSVAEQENLEHHHENNVEENEKENIATNKDATESVSPKKKVKKSKLVSEEVVKMESNINSINDDQENGKKKKKIKANKSSVEENSEPLPTELQSQSPKKKNKKNKNKKQKSNKLESELVNNKGTDSTHDPETKIESQNKEINEQATTETQSQTRKKKNKKQKRSNDEIIESINLNSITNKDTDSEHESDNEVQSEDDEINKKALETTPSDSSEDEAEVEEKKEKNVAQTEAKKETYVTTEDEIKRTLFVGNVPFSSKCKKEIKKIFSEYGQIETVRIRTIPVKDARVTPKIAVIKNELHPDRNTVNVYVKYADPSCVERALAANNTVLNGNHLRVTRSDTTGATHDPKCAVFVGNIPFALEDETLRAKFEKCGEIHSVRIVRDTKTNAGKGFGYVNFVSKDGVELALALTEEDLTIKNRILRVKRCTQPTQKKQNNNKFNRNTHTQGYNSNSKQNFGSKFQGKQKDNRIDGAYRRVFNKRKHQESNDGPPNKRQNMNQPHRDKKERKEFVGMTAEKKKKQKFNKGQKKKKVLSEILTKK